MKRVISFAFWLVASVAIFGFAIESYVSGEMTRSFFYAADADGYAVDTEAFASATADNPVYLSIVTSDEVAGPVAVPIKAGERLPRGADGVLTRQAVQEAKLVALDGDRLKVKVHHQIKEASGFKYRDSFRHKDVEANPWSGAWNLAVILIMGLSLGMLAQSFTNLLGVGYGPRLQPGPQASLS